MDCMNEKMRVIYGDWTLGLQGEGFRYIFSYTKGGPESLVMSGMEWLYRTPMPTFWRATTDNDRGSRFPLKSGMWLSADMFLKCTGIRVAVDGQEIELPMAPVNNRYSDGEFAGKVKLTFTYETITVPAACVDVAYEVSAEGNILVDVWYHGVKGLPELPVFGMRFIAPTKAVGYRYEGLSGETYPDRMAGGEEGVYDVQGLPVTPYLVPQECGMHMETKWVEVYRDTVLDNRMEPYGTKPERGVFRVAASGENFAFSCLPFTAEELENATHQEELPPERRTVLCILGAVRGVGGIDSWGTDVEPRFHISAEEDIRYSFRIEKDERIRAVSD